MDEDEDEPYNCCLATHSDELVGMRLLVYDCSSLLILLATLGGNLPSSKSFATATETGMGRSRSTFVSERCFLVLSVERGVVSQEEDVAEDEEDDDVFVL